MGYIAAIKAVHRARKLGRATHIAVSLPVIKMSNGLINTVEGSVLTNCLTREQYNAVNARYKEVSEVTRQAMVCSAKSGEYLARAQWWRRFLLETLCEKDAHGAMIALLRWYRRCIILRLQGTEQSYEPQYIQEERPTNEP